MKVLQIDKYYYIKGGAETVFFNTIHLLQNNGHEVIPFCLKSKKNDFSTFESYFVDYPELSECGIFTKIKHIPSFIYNKKAAQQIEKLIVEQKPDIAHIHLLFNSHSVSILPVLKKYHIPVVMTVHDYRLICPAYTFRNGKGEVCEKCIDHSYLNCILQKCSNNNLGNSTILALDSIFRSVFYKPINYIDKFVFVSEFAKQKHIQANPLYANKAAQLYNFTPHIATKKGTRGNYLLYFGRISNEKGILTLINAMKSLPNIPLKIAGTGPLSESLKQYNLPNIEWLGFKKGAELEQLIKNAMYVVVPSEWYENNPLSIIESMAMGVPVIGSNIGGIPELIQHQKNGFLFQTESVSELGQMIDFAFHMTDSQYYEISNNAIEFANAHFSEDSHYQKLMQIYDDCIKNKTV